MRTARGPAATLLTAVLLAVPAAPAAAQAGPGLDVSGALMRGVPAGQPTSGVLPLSLADAVKRGLDHNLAAVIQEQQTRSASGARLQALSTLLPHVSANVRQSAQVINTAAFGFSGFAGLPNIIGPFTVFDARLAVSAPLIDLSAFAGWRSARANAEASDATYRQIRETVVLAVGNLYLEAVADAARVDSAHAQFATADALAVLTADQNAAGIVARVDMLRQQVQRESARTVVITAENQLAKRKLELARAIGLPAGQQIELTDKAAFSPAPDISIDAAVEEATSHRDDLKGAQARVEAARAAHRAAVGQALPSLRLDADVGALGLSASSAERTYTVAATLHVPIFEGGSARARGIETDAELKQREAELADLTAGVRYDVTAALLDLKAAEAGVDTATRAQQLAQEALAQAEDRFRAGVASSVELVQAQESVARASEQYIAGVYAHNVAKAAFARALGEGETRFLAMVGGQP